ncbi:MAG: cysteine desulfurase family protein [Planctomycetota bacterium]|jgi:cysteine desulfurase
MGEKTYFDHSAATPLLREALDAMLPYLRESFGNKQSLVYDLGREASEGVEKARRRVARLIGAEPEDIVFTSSGSESNNLAVKGIARARARVSMRVIVSAIEHHSVMHSARRLAEDGFEVVQLPVDGAGLVDPDDLKDALSEGAALVSIMHANAEVGTIEPVRELAGIARERGVPFHTDAVATAGTLPVDVNGLGVDALSLAASQFHGPKGAGALYVRKGLRLTPQIDGGVQERGLRAGTENVPAIVGMGKAAQIAANGMDDRNLKLRGLRDGLIAGVRERIERVTLTGHPTLRLPGHATFCIEFIEGEAMLLMLATEGIAASSGSTCSSKALKASHVLTAMGVPPEVAQGSLVMSLGRDNTEADVARVLDVLPKVVGGLREISPLYAKWRKEAV